MEHYIYINHNTEFFYLHVYILYFARNDHHNLQESVKRVPYFQTQN